ncbi:hypothetical protein [Caminibacter sp.]
MFNVKITSFLSKITQNKKEQKYLKKILYKVTDEKEKKLLEYFLYSNTFSEIKDFLSKQKLINYIISPEDFEKNINYLKEKIAYELNEAILKKYS